MVNKKTFAVDVNKLPFPTFGKNKEWFETASLPDGSVSVFIWSRHCSEVQLDLRKKMVAWGKPYGEFELTPTIEEKKLLLTLAITRPSERYFKVLALSKNGVTDYACINYKEVNATLEKLIAPYY